MADEFGISVGQYIKVRIPGETPWVEVLKVDGANFQVRIDSDLFCGLSRIEQARFTKDVFGTVKNLPLLHDYRTNDKVWFHCVPIHEVKVSGEVIEGE